MRISAAGRVIGIVALLAGWGARAEDRLIIRAVDVTPEGRKLAPPTPAKPTYYVPVFLGYQERGDLIGHFELKPADDMIHRWLVALLALQGYQVASREFPPTLTITFEWGSVAPVFRSRRVINAAEIRAIVVGDAQGDASLRFAGMGAEIMSLTARHYLLISAFAYQRRADTEDVLLWRAHATTDAWGNYLEEVIQPLIATAAPLLGREIKPGAAWLEPTGRVVIGEPEVKDFPAARPAR